MVHAAEVCRCGVRMKKGTMRSGRFRPPSFQDPNRHRIPVLPHQLRLISRRFSPTPRPPFVPALGHVSALDHPVSNLHGPELWAFFPEGGRDFAERLYCVARQFDAYALHGAFQRQQHETARILGHTKASCPAFPACQSQCPIRSHCLLTSLRPGFPEHAGLPVSLFSRRSH